MLFSSGVGNGSKHDDFGVYVCMYVCMCVYVI